MMMLINKRRLMLINCEYLFMLCVNSLYIKHKRVSLSDSGDGLQYYETFSEGVHHCGGIHPR